MQEHETLTDKLIEESPEEDGDCHDDDRVDVTDSPPSGCFIQGVLFLFQGFHFCISQLWWFGLLLNSAQPIH